MGLKQFIRKYYLRLGDYIGIVTCHFEKPKTALVWIDGGYASQVMRYIMGKILEEKGFSVKYNLIYFDRVKERSEDAHYRFVLKEAFPDLDVPEPSKWERKRYMYLYDALYSGVSEKYKGHIEDYNGPFAIHNYEFDWIMDGYDKRKYLPWGSLENRLSDKAKIIAEDIRTHDSVSIHVRRGDMSYYVPGSYWRVLTPDYFVAAVDIVKQYHSSPKYYIFTEDIGYVKKELIPALSLENIIIVSEEKSLTVYEELYLMSLCRTSVGSQGSWGRYAYWFKEGERRYIGYTTEKDKPDITDPYNEEHWIYLERNMYLSEEQVREGMDSK